MGVLADQWFHWEGASGAIRRWAHRPQGELTQYSQWPRLPQQSSLHLSFNPLYLPPYFYFALPIPFSSSSSSSFLSSVSWCWEQSSIFRPRLLRSSHLAPVASMLSPWPVDTQHIPAPPQPAPREHKGQRIKAIKYLWHHLPPQKSVT